MTIADVEQAHSYEFYLSRPTCISGTYSLACDDLEPVEAVKILDNVPRRIPVPRRVSREGSVLERVAHNGVTVQQDFHRARKWESGNVDADLEICTLDGLIREWAQNLDVPWLPDTFVRVLRRYPVPASRLP